MLGGGGGIGLGDAQRQRHRYSRIWLPGACERECCRAFTHADPQDLQILDATFPGPNLR